MFEHLKEYDKILVSGPQRSGTRICAKMIANDLAYEYVDEDDFKISNLGRLKKVMEKSKIVVHCPAVSRWLHELVANDVLIIFMRRDIEDIIASQERIGWNDSFQLRFYNTDEGIISKVKYGFWEAVQKPLIKHWLEVEYKSLTEHPLWIPKDRRKNFKPRQTLDSQENNR